RIGGRKQAEDPRSAREISAFELLHKPRQDRKRKAEAEHVDIDDREYECDIGPAGNRRFHLLTFCTSNCPSRRGVYPPAAARTLSFQTTGNSARASSRESRSPYACRETIDARTDRQSFRSDPHRTDPARASARSRLLFRLARWLHRRRRRRDAA